jgi:hypothetical protein
VIRIFIGFDPREAVVFSALSAHWNHPAGYDPSSRGASPVHFAVGGPYVPQYANCEYADAWRAERDAMLFAVGD